MSYNTADTSVLTEIIVDAPIERAFRVFTERFDHIKPREHNMLAVSIAQSVFEPKVGGRIYDRGIDGSECQWGRVLAYEPPTRLVFSWDIKHTLNQDDRHPDGISKGKDRFADGDDRRRWSKPSRAATRRNWRERPPCG